jgi:hypothetical protein
MIIILEQTSMSICIMDRRFVNVAFYTRVCRVCKGKSLVGCEGWCTPREPGEHWPSSDCNLDIVCLGKCQVHATYVVDLGSKAHVEQRPVRTICETKVVMPVKILETQASMAV